MGQFTQELDKYAAALLNSIAAHWKTTGGGALLSIIAGFVLFAPEYFPPPIVGFMKYLTVAGIAGLGAAAKDKSKA